MGRAARYLIVEDDPYGEIYFEDVASAGETRPLKADDRRGRVIYLSTFSKTLAPGFRVAWVAAPAPIVERFDTAKQSMDLMCGILDQRVVHQSIVRGVLDRQAAPLRQLYRMRRDVMEQALREQLGGRLTWIAPKGGFFLWARLPDGYECEPLLARRSSRACCLSSAARSAWTAAVRPHSAVVLVPSPERIREGQPPPRACHAAELSNADVRGRRVEGRSEDPPLPVCDLARPALYHCEVLCLV